MPATALLVHPASAPAATVLAVEGTAQKRGNAQTAFNSAFCEHNTCRSINNARSPFDVKPGSRQLQAAVDSTGGDIVLMGYSLGAATIYDRLREWEKTPAQAPDVDRVVLVVTYGNPENKFGGDDRKNYYAGLPASQPYQHLDVTMQYDSVADVPTRFGWYSQMNIAFGRHLAYFQDVDINDPDNLVYRDEDGSTYMLIKADTLPMLAWMDPWITDERMAELDAKYRPLIEKDYDRPAYVPQGEGADWGNGNPPPSIDDDDDDDADVDVADVEEVDSQSSVSDEDQAAPDTDEDGDVTRKSRSREAAPATETTDEDGADDADADSMATEEADGDEGPEASPQE
ncbi:PE-PPE domain-containing protein [Mycolicibacterium sp. BiH015]|uniref:PE-PPE domain-containing protein n=1 Tax=Mycolicibacterium sp. BiH015 TaxID=3018808 RepID=UPI0022E23AF9|nr:PE-PPE domain-containing protein [Mycolicibacterium sp. BiH015]MDA2892281.1 PE-PPE domain-containing protein [Mycolicibacterium sp. BiH015]